VLSKLRFSWPAKTGDNEDHNTPFNKLVQQLDSHLQVFAWEAVL
jgi:hypothetical protein